MTSCKTNCFCTQSQTKNDHAVINFEEKHSLLLYRDENKKTLRFVSPEV